MESLDSAKPIDRRDSPVGAGAPTECLAQPRLYATHDEYLFDSRDSSHVRRHHLTTWIWSARPEVWVPAPPVLHMGRRRFFVMPIAPVSGKCTIVIRLVEPGYDPIH